MMQHLMKPSGWIWTPQWTIEDKEVPRLVCFRRVLEVESVPTEMRVHISADSRYKLYVNGKLVEVGPSKGDGTTWYYDEKDIAPFLQQGKNTLVAFVLRYPQLMRKGNYGVWRTETPGFYLKGADGTVLADEHFKVKMYEDYEIVSEDPYFAPLQIFEKVTGNKAWKGIMTTTYDDCTWEDAFVYPEAAIQKGVSPGNLFARTIPYMTQIKRSFVDVVALRQTHLTKDEWVAFIKQQKPLHIPPHTKEIVEISAGELMTGYLQLSVAQGKGAKIKLLQSESYYVAGKKGDRTDAVNGILQGFVDDYSVAGYGTNEEPEVYEPFWFRTFRYIQLEITTGEEALALCTFNYRETGYPLEVRTHVETSDASLNQIWEMSERTLKRCMHETYEDCPFYEQLQYAMDSRSQILYTYQVAADDRLARQCMTDLKHSARPDGMINCCYPQYGPNIIPGFSIFYIGMVYDHMMYFGDRELIKDHLPTIEGILRYFEKHLTAKGLVDKVGGPIMEEAYWSFIDWTPQWRETAGVPLATRQGGLTMESLLYILGLQYAAKLSTFLGYEERAQCYEERACHVQEAINTSCRGVHGLYQDGPGIEAYSQHAQVFAILTNTVSQDEGQKLLQLTLTDKEKYAPCSVAMAYYLYRAAEKVGLYKETEKFWDVWRKMLANNCSTCVEDDVNGRSDCHAWGALALYEIPAVILGIQPEKEGFEKIVIAPHTSYLAWAKGEVITPKGMLTVAWEKDEVGHVTVNYTAPEGVAVTLKECIQ